MDKRNMVSLCTKPQYEEQTDTIQYVENGRPLKFAQGRWRHGRIKNSKKSANLFSVGPNEIY
jgi:hypothetical protein